MSILLLEMLPYSTDEPTDKSMILNRTEALRLGDNISYIVIYYTGVYTGLPFLPFIKTG